MKSELCCSIGGRKHARKRPYRFLTIQLTLFGNELIEKGFLQYLEIFFPKNGSSYNRLLILKRQAFQGKNFMPYSCRLGSFSCMLPLPYHWFPSLAVHIESVSIEPYFYTPCVFKYWICLYLIYDAYMVVM